MQFCMCIILTFLICLSYNCIIVHGSLPEYIHVCHRNDPKISECIVKSVEILRPKLREGIPDLNVPPMEPLHLGNMYLQRGSQTTRVNLNLTDVSAWGPSTFIIKSINHNIQKNLFEFRVLIPKLYFRGRYSINMNILFLQLNGNGNINGTFSKFVADAKMQGHKIQNRENNSVHLFFDKIRIHLTIGQTVMKLEGLFDQDPLLNKAANDILHTNSDVFIEEIRPALESSLGDVFTKIANAITGSFQYDELFPL